MQRAPQPAGSGTDCQPQLAGTESPGTPKLPGAAPKAQHWSNTSGGLRTWKGQWEFCTWKGQQEFPHPGKSQAHLLVPLATPAGAQLRQPGHLGRSLQQRLTYYNERLTQESCRNPAPCLLLATSCSSSPFPAHPLISKTLSALSSVNNPLTLILLADPNPEGHSLNLDLICFSSLSPPHQSPHPSLAALFANGNVLFPLTPQIYVLAGLHSFHERPQPGSEQPH